MLKLFHHIGFHDFGFAIKTITTHEFSTNPIYDQAGHNICPTCQAVKVRF